MSGSGDSAHVSVSVAVPPAQAFEIFTREIDRWWRRGPKFRNAGRRAGLIHLEPQVGGRLFESLVRAARRSSGPPRAGRCRVRARDRALVG